MDIENDQCEKPRRSSAGVAVRQPILTPAPTGASFGGPSQKRGRIWSAVVLISAQLETSLGVELAAEATMQAPPNRRDFLFLATGAAGAVGVAALAWPFIDQMNPDATTLALSSIEVDLGAIPEGQIVTVKWRGGPVFVRHRTKKEIEEAQNVPLSELRDPQPDAQRVQKPEWLIVVGVCTHLGCVPLGHEGKYEGWFCPCHGSMYDTSGRIRQGPAPLNLAVPNYAFLTDTKVKIG
jgi:ubiquinol-cytochrome c reductase iron-sulfur subunit